MNVSADVRSRDFLQTHAGTPLCEEYIAAGAPCRLSTNSERVLAAAREAFNRVEAKGPEGPRFSIRIWVNEGDTAQPPWPNPYVRGLDHLVYVGFDSRSSLLADLMTRRVIGRFSAGMAGDSRYWRMTILPMLMSVMAGSLGLLELHSSCVAKGSSGVLILGPARSGKSTLAMAMSLASFRVLSDDRAFCSVEKGKLLAYGLPRPVKLRRDAGTWFSQFRNIEPRHRQNGEDVFYSNLILRAPEPCEPKAIVCLERNGEDCRISRMEPIEISRRIEADLMAENRNAVEKQQRVIDRLLQLPCWRVQYGARPEVVAEEIAKLLPKGADRDTD